MYYLHIIIVFPCASFLSTLLQGVGIMLLLLLQYYCNYVVAYYIYSVVALSKCISL
jgi:hypothetical protein